MQRGLHQLHAEQFDSALTTAGSLQKSWPTDPAGFLMAANVYQTMMRNYRVRLFEAEFSANIETAIKLAEQQARKSPSPEAFFALGSAKGYNALHLFRRGNWSRALRDGVISLNAMERSLSLDRDFVDPMMALALYDYWKSVKLDFGLRLFAKRHERAVWLLEKVWQNGRYLSVDAAYALQSIELKEPDLQRALEINDWLFERFPTSPSCLYYRALIFEGQGESSKALACWEKLIERILAFGQPSDGYLAECYWHCARIRQGMTAAAAPAAKEQIIIALGHANRHALNRDPDREMEGLFESSEAIQEGIEHMLKEYESQR